MQVNFITGIKFAKSHGFSVYEKNLYNNLKNKIDFNVISIRPVQIPVSRTLQNNFSLYTIYPLLVKLKSNKDAITHITAQKNAFVLNFINPKYSIVTCHDIIPHIFKEFEGIRKYLFGLSVKGMHKSDKIITVSNSTKNDLINYLNFKEDKIKVIHESIDTNRFKPIKNAKKKIKEIQY